MGYSCAPLRLRWRSRSKEQPAVSKPRRRAFRPGVMATEIPQRTGMIAVREPLSRAAVVAKGRAQETAAQKLADKDHYVEKGSALALEALLIALEHDQGTKPARSKGGPWYVSMEQLLLASARLCASCRRRRNTWNVRVTPATPRRLWLRRARDEYERRRSSYSRVPALLVHSISWDMDCAGGTSGSGVPPGEGRKQAKMTTGVQAGQGWWPRSLAHLTFADGFDSPVHDFVFPDTLQTLSFGRKFNQNLRDVSFPPGLISLTLGSYFDKSVEDVAWPASLQQLMFGVCYNQPIAGMRWPASLMEITFGHTFHQPIEEVAWPPSLKRLTFGWNFNQTIEGVAWPDSLQELAFGYRFNQKIGDIAWPRCLQQLTVGKAFRQPLDSAKRAGVRVSRIR